MKGIYSERSVEWKLDLISDNHTELARGGFRPTKRKATRKGLGLIAQNQSKTGYLVDVDLNIPLGYTLPVRIIAL